jgi:Gram-negative porin
MKKTLVALAVLAASGASFAQVALTGEFAYGYLATTNGAGATASGGGLDTSLLSFGVTEDLGGGTKVSVTMKTDGTSGRSGAIANDDQMIDVKTSFASFKMASWKPANWLQGNTGYAGWYGLDGRVLAARGIYDSIGVSAPVGPVTLSATAYEPSGSLGEGSGNAGTSLQQNTTLGLGYNAGAMSLSAGYVTYNNQNGTDSTSKNVVRVAGKYDFGVAAIGAGVAVQNLGDGGTNTQTLVSLSAPLGGALSANAGWASNKTDVSATSTLAASNGTKTGYQLGLQYNLSKRTYGILNYGNWLNSVADAQNSNLTALTLVHDF